MARYGAPQKRPPAPAKISDGRKSIVTTRLTPENRDKAQRAAEALGISLSAFLNELVDRLEVDENGHPGWESRYAQADDDQEQLEMSA